MYGHEKNYFSYYCSIDFSKKFIVGYVDFCDKNVIVDYWCLNKVRKLEGRDNQ